MCAQRGYGARVTSRLVPLPLPQATLGNNKRNQFRAAAQAAMFARRCAQSLLTRSLGLAPDQQEDEDEEEEEEEPKEEPKVDWEAEEEEEDLNLFGEEAAEEGAVLVNDGVAAAKEGGDGDAGSAKAAAEEAPRQGEEPDLEEPDLEEPDSEDEEAAEEAREAAKLEAEDAAREAKETAARVAREAKVRAAEKERRHKEQLEELKTMVIADRKARKKRRKQMRSGLVDGEADESGSEGSDDDDEAAIERDAIAAMRDVDYLEKNEVHPAPRAPRPW